MPALPPLALVLGYFLVHSRWNAGWAPLCVAGLMALLLCGFHVGLLPWYAAYRSPLRQDGEVARLCGDRHVPLVCYPAIATRWPSTWVAVTSAVIAARTSRTCATWCGVSPRVVVLCTHRNSFEGLEQLLPPEVKVVEHVYCGLPDIAGVPRRWMKPLKKWLGQTALGLGDIAVVQPR